MLRAITKAICEENDEVMREVESCLADPEAYFENHLDQFDERGIEEYEEIEEEISWLTMVDALENNGYACEVDWSAGVEDFMYLLGELKGVQMKELPLDEEWFDEEGDVSEWCEMLDGKWASKGVAVMGIDIDSDSYVLFPYELDLVDELCEMAEAIDQRIDFGKNM